MTAALLLLVLLAPIARAQEVTVFDSDNFARGFHPPSMEQAVSWSAAFYDVSHRALHRPWQVALFDLTADVILPLPLSDTWTHEEFHRAVLANRGVASFDDVYRFRFAAAAIAVSHVRDDSLVRMKHDHPADFVRAHAAGIEGEHALVLRLEKQRFFDGATSWNAPLYWLVKVNTIAYVASGSSNDTNSETEKWERQEGAHISRRDFTGHDFTAWVYDLFRPDEPYAARGIHPSGVGIRRYIRESDLTDAERSYLRRQGRLSVINLVDPYLFDYYGGRFNLTASHLLTPFGYSIDANVFVRDPKLFVTVHDYVNHERNLPGVDVTFGGGQRPSAVRTAVGGCPPLFRVALWRQPDHLRFRDRGGRLGGLVSARVRRGKWFAELEAKSAGWVEGNVHLDKSVSVRAGVYATP